MNTHGYQQGGGRRDLLYAATRGKRLWNSEYGEEDSTGLSLASNLNLDFAWLHNTVGKQSLLYYSVLVTVDRRMSLLILHTPIAIASRLGYIGRYLTDPAGDL